jgi:hypothetical protein
MTNPGMFSQSTISNDELSGSYIAIYAKIKSDLGTFSK